MFEREVHKPGEGHDAVLMEQYPLQVPHCGQLGQKILRIGQGRLRMQQPYAEHLLGDAERGLIHSSVQLTLVDSGLGAAVLSVFDAPEAIATLDLRMDYHRPALAGMDLFLDAQVERITRQIVFVSGVVWQSAPEQITARARATFMRGAGRHLPVRTA